MAMVDLMRGRSPSSRCIPPQVMEFFMAKEFGWSLEYIRNLRVSDYSIMAQLLNVYQSANRHAPK